MKTFQRLGYFVRHADIPAIIVEHVAACAGYPHVPDLLHAYDRGTTRDRHKALVRDYLGVSAYSKEARRIALDACFRAARTREDLPDIINMALEELIRPRYELPALSTLLRIARSARSAQNRAYQTRVFAALDGDARQRLQWLLRREEGQARSAWDRIKREPKRPTVPQLRECLEHLRWLQQLNGAAAAFADIPEVKIRQVAAEARSLEVASLNGYPCLHG